MCVRQAGNAIETELQSGRIRLRPTPSQPSTSATVDVVSPSIHPPPIYPIPAVPHQPPLIWSVNRCVHSQWPVTLWRGSFPTRLWCMSVHFSDISSSPSAHLCKQVHQSVPIGLAAIEEQAVGHVSPMVGDARGTAEPGGPGVLDGNNPQLPVHVLDPTIAAVSSSLPPAMTALADPTTELPEPKSTHGHDAPDGQDSPCAQSARDSITPSSGLDPETVKA